VTPDIQILNVLPCCPSIFILHAPCLSAAMLAVHTRENTFGDLTNRPATRQSSVSKQSFTRDSQLANRKTSQGSKESYVVRTPTRAAGSGEDGDENMSNHPHKSKDASLPMVFSPEDKENIDPVRHSDHRTLCRYRYLITHTMFTGYWKEKSRAQIRRCCSESETAFCCARDICRC
jgi:hypothetical protein